MGVSIYRTDKSVVLNHQGNRLLLTTGGSGWHLGAAAESKCSVAFEVDADIAWSTLSVGGVDLEMSQLGRVPPIAVHNTKGRFLGFAGTEILPQGRLSARVETAGWSG